MSSSRRHSGPPSGQRKTKIRYYCGLCQIACKDENGYKNHIQSESHIRRELVIDESVRSFKLSKEDKKFRKKFIDHLIRKYFGQTVLAHEVYRDLYPLDRGHNVMKSTSWETLGVFIAQLRKDGRIEAQKGVKGWQIRVSDDTILDEVVSSSGEEDQSADKVAATRQKRKSSDSNPSTTETIQPRSESSKRMGDGKVAFNLGAKLFVGGAKPVANVAATSAFGADSEDSEH